MADITKCSDEECPINDTCYRYTAEPNEYYQSYFVNTPIKEDGSCDHYWHRCKHTPRDGESCNLNNKCQYPNCDEDGPLRPIHKLSGTLCHHCRTILSGKHTEDLFCPTCKAKREEMFNKLKK